MDLCTGGNLLDYMKKKSAPNAATAASPATTATSATSSNGSSSSSSSESMAKDFLRQMLYAVKYLHEHQIVHRCVIIAAMWLSSHEHQRASELPPVFPSKRRSIPRDRQREGRGLG